MNASLFYFYGIFLISCGIVSVIFIGLKAKTALMSGGMSGLLSILIAYFIDKGAEYAQIFGIILPAGLFIVFAWRSTKTLFRIFELLTSDIDKSELKGKGIAFLIISLMAVTSLFVFTLHITTIK